VLYMCVCVFLKEAYIRALHTKERSSKARMHYTYTHIHTHLYSEGRISWRAPHRRGKLQRNNTSYIHAYIHIQILIYTVKDAYLGALHTEEGSSKARMTVQSTTVSGAKLWTSDARPGTVKITEWENSRARMKGLSGLKLLTCRY
jgi:hypothetical protein